MEPGEITNQHTVTSSFTYVNALYKEGTQEGLYDKPIIIPCSQMSFCYRLFTVTEAGFLRCLPQQDSLFIAYCDEH